MKAIGRVGWLIIDCAPSLSAVRAASRQSSYRMAHDRQRGRVGPAPRPESQSAHRRESECTVIRDNRAERTIDDHASWIIGSTNHVRAEERASGLRV